MSSIYTILFGAALCSCVVLLAYSAPIAAWLGVMDHPNSDRKRHAGAVPLMGGISIIAALSLWIIAALFLEPAGDARQFMLAVLICRPGCHSGWLLR